MEDFAKVFYKDLIEDMGCLGICDFYTVVTGRHVWSESESSKGWAALGVVGTFVGGGALGNLGSIGKRFRVPSSKSLSYDVSSWGDYGLPSGHGVANKGGALILNSAGSAVNKTMQFTQSQIQKKYSSHAKHFGFTGNPNKANLEAFRKAIVDHPADANTLVIQGTYRKVQDVHHFYNSNTGINVMRDMNGYFLSGWKLSAGQAENVMTRGSL
jgi:hypothetical protein